MKTPQQRNSSVRNLLVGVLVIMALPLFLEFIVFLPLLALHLIVGLSFWVFGATISITGIIAAIVGACATIWLLLGGKKHKVNTTIKQLSHWVTGLFFVYLLVLLALLIAWMVSYHQ